MTKREMCSQSKHESYIFIHNMNYLKRMMYKVRSQVLVSSHTWCIPEENSEKSLTIDIIIIENTE